MGVVCSHIALTMSGVRPAFARVCRRTILFVSCMLLLGALIRISVPSWIPYTVFVLVFCMFTGMIAHKMSEGDACPWHAFAFAGGDNKLDRTEWNRYLCVGCHPESYCLSKGHPLGLSGSGAYTCAASHPPRRASVHARARPRARARHTIMHLRRACVRHGQRAAWLGRAGARAATARPRRGSAPWAAARTNSTR